MIVRLVLNSIITSFLIFYYQMALQYQHFPQILEIVTAFNEVITHHFYNTNPLEKESLLIPPTAPPLTPTSSSTLTPSSKIPQSSGPGTNASFAKLSEITTTTWFPSPLSKDPKEIVNPMLLISSHQVLAPQRHFLALHKLGSTLKRIQSRKLQADQYPQYTFKLHCACSRNSITSKEEPHFQRRTNSRTTSYSTYKKCDNIISPKSALYKFHIIFVLKKKASFLPPTYRLYDKDECSNFFTYIQSHQYQNLYKTQGPQFIMKMGKEVHKGKGVDLLLEENIQTFQNIYRNGEKCGKNNTLMTVQKYISNPFLYKGHKLEFRFYFMIASSYPLIVYVYERPLIKRCALPFDIFSKEKAAHICNTAIVKTLMNQTEGEAEKEQEIGDEDEEFFIDWNLDGLQELLLQEGKIQSDRWLEEEFVPNVYGNIIHVIRSTQEHFEPDSKFSEFLAVDFFLTDDFQITVLEVNYNPQVLTVTEDRIKRNVRMMKDLFEILELYLRAKYLRIRNLIHEVLREYHSSAGSDLETIILSKKPAFLEAYKDNLDHLQISSSNLFRKIIDESYPGPEKYHGFMDPQCLF